MNQLSIAIRQIRRNLLRSVLMAVGVCLFTGVMVGVTLLIVGVNQSIGRTVDRLGADLMVIPRGEDVAAQFNEALITGKPTHFYLPRARLDQIAAQRDVARVAAQTYAQTLTNARCCSGHFFLVGFERASDFTVQPWLKQAPETWPPDDQDWIVVGDRILLHVGDTVTFYGTTFTVAAVLSPTGTGMDWTVYVPLPGLRRMVDHSALRAITPLQIDPNDISAIFVRSEPGVDLIDLAEKIEADCPDCQAVLSSSVGKLARAQLKVVTVISLGVVGALWIVAGLLSGVVFAQAVRERRGEIGLFLAKGAEGRFIAGMLAREALLIALTASLAGAGAAVLVVTSFRQLLGVSLGVSRVLPDLKAMLVLVLGLAVLAGFSAVFCSLLPVLSMLRAEPYEAIKGGGRS
jgi:putative ABC transport system permease protein